MWFEFAVEGDFWKNIFFKIFCIVVFFKKFKDYVTFTTADHMSGWVTTTFQKKKMFFFLQKKKQKSKILKKNSFPLANLNHIRVIFSQKINAYFR